MLTSIKMLILFQRYTIHAANSPAYFWQENHIVGVAPRADPVLFLRVRRGKISFVMEYGNMVTREPLESAHKDFVCDPKLKVLEPSSTATRFTAQWSKLWFEGGHFISKRLCRLPLISPCHVHEGPTMTTVRHGIWTYYRVTVCVVVALVSSRRPSCPPTQHLYPPSCISHDARNE